MGGVSYRMNMKRFYKLSTYERNDLLRAQLIISAQKITEGGSRLNALNKIKRTVLIKQDRFARTEQPLLFNSMKPSLSLSLTPRSHQANTGTDRGEQCKLRGDGCVTK